MSNIIRTPLSSQNSQLHFFLPTSVKFVAVANADKALKLSKKIGFSRTAVGRLAPLPPGPSTKSDHKTNSSDQSLASGDHHSILGRHDGVQQSQRAEIPSSRRS